MNESKVKGLEWILVNIEGGFCILSLFILITLKKKFEIVFIFT